jgi:flagellin-specific chaperone FliS
MLMELPKANLNHETEIIVRSMNYIRELKKLWEERVMGLNSAKNTKNDSPAKKNDPGERKTLSVAI